MDLCREAREDALLLLMEEVARDMKLKDRRKGFLKKAREAIGIELEMEEMNKTKREISKQLIDV